jgi:pyruvate formate lyase activating enzyme
LKLEIFNLPIFKIMTKKIFAILFIVIILGLVGYLIFSREKTANPQALYQAKYYEKLSGKMVQCGLCPNRCILSQGQIGLCKARKNIDGELYSLNYGNVAAQHIDPIEKKPFFHFLPGSKAYSISTTGCNMRCSFCQNWDISQVFPWEIETKKMTPAEVVADALKNKSEVIAFTYNEPVVYYEYIYDIAKLAREEGLKTVIVSNGYINPEPLKALLPYIDAYKVDLKAFKEEFYQKFTGGHLVPVLEAIKIIKESGTWLEIVNLLVPGENDSEEEIKEMAKWIKDNVGDDAPLHFSAFHPEYKLQNLPPTPAETIIKAREIATAQGLKFVYTGNIIYPQGESTYCPNSKTLAVARQGYMIMKNNLVDGKCPDGEIIPGVWK